MYVNIAGYQLFVVNTIEMWMCFLLAYRRKLRFNVFNLILQDDVSLEMQNEGNDTIRKMIVRKTVRNKKSHSEITRYGTSFFTLRITLGLSQIPTVLLRENAHQIDNCIYGKEARHTNVCHLSRQVVHVRHLSHVVYSLTCDIYLLLFLLRFPSMPANCHFCYLLLDYELYRYSYNRIWKLFILLQPAPVVLGLFTKRRGCWGSQPHGGNGSFPWESLSRIWPLRPWMNSSECWFLEIWWAAAIASDCLSNVEVNLELPSPLIPHLSPTGTTCWFLPIYYTSFLLSVLTYMS